jgi:NAD(P)-dependent dehydrogenase (short-subunit alcohol dehydrogenase family)
MQSPSIQRDRLHDRVALVTGAGGGIGQAIARRLGAEGARVLVTDVDAPSLAETARRLEEDRAEADAVEADLSDLRQGAQLVCAATERWGKLDILVNNATFLGARTPFLQSDDADWQKVFTVNVLAIAALCRAAAAGMVERQDGAIVNVSSIQAKMPVATYAAYAASKGAMESLTRALAVELSGKGVRVNALAPGFIATPAFETTLAQNFSAGSEPPAATLLERKGLAKEIAAAVAFLAGPDASFITGAVLTVDGGRSISRRPDPFNIAFGNTSPTGKS